MDHGKCLCRQFQMFLRALDQMHKASHCQTPAHPDNDTANGNGFTLQTINFVKCFNCLFILLSRPYNLWNCGGVLLYKTGEDWGHPAMNIFWHSSRTVLLYKAVSEIHFAHGQLCPLLDELCCSGSEGPDGRAELQHITEPWRRMLMY